jgi:MoaA/NifB/PqqE/SkfB family radical SAM enzyme
VAPIRFLEIEPTTRCNFTCGFCAGRHMVQQDLPLATFEAALDTFPETTNLELQGEGEPLLQPHFFEMAARARARDLSVACITNGSLLSAENVRRLLDADLDKLLVSFESLDPASFRRLRGGLVEKVIEGLGRLVRERDARGLRRPAIGLAVTVLKDTVGELPAFVELYRRLGLDGGINVQPLNPMPGYARHYDASLASQALSDQELRRHLETLRAEPVYGIALDGSSSTRGFFDELFAGFTPGRRSCPWLERGAFVTADGWVTPCCTIKDGERAGFGKVGPGGERQRAAARQALAQELREGRTPDVCQGCAVAALAIAEPAASGTERVLDDLVALELEFSWVHSSWLALQRDRNVRLIPAVTDAAVRLEELRARLEERPASPPIEPNPVEGSATPAETEALRARLLALEREKDGLAVELAAARARVTALLGSWSWRLLRPLRAVHGLLGPNRR